MIENIISLENLPTKELEEIIETIVQIRQDRIKERVKQQLELNKAYLHKCFYNFFNNSYYKIISEKGNNENQVTALIFGEIPIFSFTGIESGYWTLKTFTVESVSIEKLCDKKFFKEIEKEAWEEAFEVHIRVLKEI